VQATGIRPSRALPYELHVQAEERAKAAQLALTFANTGPAAAVFHVYDKNHLDRIPRRYTVGAGHEIGGEWDTNADEGRYDLWVLGPNGFHRHFTGQLAEKHGRAPQAEILVAYDRGREGLRLTLRNRGDAPCTFRLLANAYHRRWEPQVFRVRGGDDCEELLSLRQSANWYDFTVRVVELEAYARRFAGRMETGKHSLSDPELGGRARGEHA
jgi:phospholipase C